MNEINSQSTHLSTNVLPHISVENSNAIVAQENVKQIVEIYNKWQAEKKPDGTGCAVGRSIITLYFDDKGSIKLLKRKKIYREFPFEKKMINSYNFTTKQESTHCIEYEDGIRPGNFPFYTKELRRSQSIEERRQEKEGLTKLLIKEDKIFYNHQCFVGGKKQKPTALIEIGKQFNTSTEPHWERMRQTKELFLKIISPPKS